MKCLLNRLRRAYWRRVYESNEDPVTRFLRQDREQFEAAMRWNAARAKRREKAKQKMLEQESGG